MKTKKSNRVYLHPEFVMTKEEITALNALPDNMPETKLTAAQTRLVIDLYYKYISKIDNQSWGKELYRIEMQERWPSGPRVREVQAKRIVLNALDCQQSKNGMGIREAMEAFYSSMQCRESWQRVIKTVWNVQR